MSIENIWVIAVLIATLAACVGINMIACGLILRIHAWTQRQLWLNYQAERDRIKLEHQRDLEEIES